MEMAQRSVVLLAGVALAGCLNSDIAVTTDTDTDSSGAASTGPATGSSGEPGTSSGGPTPTEASSSATTEAPGTTTDPTGAPDPVCGDGVVEAPETCDDGDQDDSDECPTSCAPAFCGDGFVQADVEACDDGNKLNADACTNACTVAVCGDGVTQLGVEACDDGDQDDSDHCTSACQVARCGDGLTHLGFEDCDDANLDDSDACLSDCRAASCGDGVLHVGVETCDDGDDDDGDECPGSCAPAVCGDGYLQLGVEACDDGNAVHADACSTKCVATPTAVVLGPGVLTPQYGDSQLGVAHLDICPQGQVLVGFSGALKNDGHATLQGLCGALKLAVADDAFVVEVGAGASLSARGGPGDTPWVRGCPAHRVVTGFTGRAGSGLEQLTLSCAPLVVSEAMDGGFSVGVGPASPLQAIGGAGGLPFAQTDCPPGQVGSAQNLRADATIAAFGLGCAAVDLAF